MAATSDEMINLQIFFDWFSKHLVNGNVDNDNNDDEVGGEGVEILTRT